MRGPFFPAGSPSLKLTNSSLIRFLDSACDGGGRERERNRERKRKRAQNCSSILVFVCVL